ncbi:hypothetical protein GIB67_030990 [Kingdonia uniflora]|uniref:Uncharacterized protein n=1 Tax=Kingdonia uniflora TaxID=39325 RepID=A0A7J7L3M2_9MAGN|nr:hypothetical protein GIB67_030990 [Kingdonia uniflora]
MAPKKPFFPLFLPYLTLILNLMVLPSSAVGGLRSQGQWSTLLNNTGVVAMHMAVTHRNTVILFDQLDAGRSGLELNRCLRSHRNASDSSCWAHSIEYHIDSNSIRPLSLATNTWCSSGSFLSNGTLLQTGGYGDGSRRIRYFKPCSNDHCNWRESKALLVEDRWYATSQNLPEQDRAIIVGGRRSFTYELVPKMSSQSRSFNLPFLRRTNSRRDNGDNLYPFVHLSSDGHLFIFANRDSILLNYKTSRVIKNFPQIPGNGSRNYPSTGSSVILPLTHTDGFKKVEVMVCGGAASGAYTAAKKGNFLKGLRSCGRMVITGTRHIWKMENMPNPRVMNDMLLLPNGDVLIINGAKNGSAGYNNAANPSLRPYIYNPKKILGKRFTVLKSTKIPRMYHSSAVLLPDGRVLIAGGNPNNHYTFNNVPFPTELRLQAFTPYYMEGSYNNRRPDNVVILYTKENHGVGYGEQFRVRFWLGQTPTKKVLKFSVYSPPFATHSISMNQRMLWLNCRGVKREIGDWVTAVLDAPPSANIAPSGYYMLNAVHDGIPSVSKWVRYKYDVANEAKSETKWETSTKRHKKRNRKRSLDLSTPILVYPTCHGMTYEEVEEADDNYYQMVRFHYMVTSGEGRRDGLRLLAEDAVTTADEAAGVHPRKSHRYPAVEGRLNIKVAELRERCFLLLPYNAVLPEWPLQLDDLDDEGRHTEYDRYFWYDMFQKASSGERNLLENQRNQSISVKGMGKVKDYGSSSTVSSSSEETSSLGREDDSRSMDETVSGREVVVDVGIKILSKVSNVVEQDDTGAKEKIFYVYPEGVDVGKLYMKFKKKLTGKWGNYVMEKGLWFTTLVPGKGEKVLDEPTLNLDHKYFNLSPDPKSFPDKTSLFDCVSLEQIELKCGGVANGVCGHSSRSRKELSMLVKGAINFIEKRNHEYLELTQKFDAQIAQMMELDEELKKEKESKAEEVKATEEQYTRLSECEETLKKALAKVRVGRNNMIQSYSHFGLTDADIHLGLVGRFHEIVFSLDAKDEPVEDVAIPVNVPLPQTEQVSAAGTGVESPYEEIEQLRKTVITLKRSLSRARDSVTRIQQEDMRKRLHRTHMQLKKHLYPIRTKVAAQTDHERHIESVIEFYGRELARVENKFRKYIMDCEKDFDKENEKAENMWFTKDEEGKGVEKLTPRQTKKLSKKNEEEAESQILRSW